MEDISLKCGSSRRTVVRLLFYHTLSPRPRMEIDVLFAPRQSRIGFIYERLDNGRFRIRTAGGSDERSACRTAGDGGRQGCLPSRGPLRRDNATDATIQRQPPRARTLPTAGLEDTMKNTTPHPFAPTSNGTCSGCGLGKSAHYNHINKTMKSETMKTTSATSQNQVKGTCDVCQREFGPYKSELTLKKVIGIHRSVVHGIKGPKSKSKSSRASVPALVDGSIPAGFHRLTLDKCPICNEQFFGRNSL